MLHRTDLEACAPRITPWASFIAIFSFAVATAGCASTGPTSQKSSSSLVTTPSETAPKDIVTATVNAVPTANAAPTAAVPIAAPPTSDPGPQPRAQIAISGSASAGNHYDSSPFLISRGSYQVRWRASNVQPDVNIGCNIQAALFDNDTADFKQNLVTETLVQDASGSNTERLPSGTWYVDLSENGCEGVHIDLLIDRIAS